MSPTYPRRYNAQRGARRELQNLKAQEGVDFSTIRDDEGNWSYVIPATGPAVRAKMIRQKQDAE